MLTKGQLISKQNCRAVTSPKKRTKRTQPSNPAYYIEDCRISSYWAKYFLVMSKFSLPHQPKFSDLCLHCRVLTSTK